MDLLLVEVVVGGIQVCVQTKVSAFKLNLYFLYIGEPNFAGSQEYCSSFGFPGGSLNDISCNATKVPLCKASAQLIQRIQPTVVSCPSGWMSYNGHCYIITLTVMTKYQADAYCSQLNKNSYLVEITSSTEFNWLVSFVQGNSNNEVWVT